MPLMSISKLHKRDKGICGICHQKVARKKANRDHIIPKCLGGPDEAYNLQISHKLCNTRKGNKLTATPEQITHIFNRVRNSMPAEQFNDLLLKQWTVRPNGKLKLKTDYLKLALNSQYDAWLKEHQGTLTRLAQQVAEVRLQVQAHIKKAESKQLPPLAERKYLATLIKQQPKHTRGYAWALYDAHQDRYKKVVFQERLRVQLLPKLLHQLQHAN